MGRRPGRGKLFAPCVVKAVASGSSIDVYICETIEKPRARRLRRQSSSKHGVGPGRRVHQGHRADRRHPRRARRCIRSASPPPASSTTLKPSTRGTSPSITLTWACPIRSSRRSAHSPNEPTKSSAAAISPASMSCSTPAPPVPSGNQHASRLHPQKPPAQGGPHAGIEFGPLVDLLARRAFQRAARRSLNRCLDQSGWRDRGLSSDNVDEKCHLRVTNRSLCGQRI